MRYFKILCILVFGILLTSCHKLSSGIITDKHIEEPKMILMPISTGKTTILVPKETERKYVITVKGKSGNKIIEEDFKVSKKDFEHFKIGDNFKTD